MLPSPLEMLIGLAIGLAIAELCNTKGALGFKTSPACAADTSCRCYDNGTKLIGIIIIYLVIGVLLAWGGPKLLSMLKSNNDAN